MLAGIGAMVLALVVAWWISALSLAGGAGVGAALAVSLMVVLGAPAAASLWKGRGRLRTSTLLLPWAALPWNAAVIAALLLAAPDPLGTALREHGWVLSSQAFGEDHHATRVTSMLSYEVADTIQTAPTADAPVTAVELPAHPNALVDVELRGPTGATTQPYLWDTGATYITLSRETARSIGIEIPSDAPIITLDTAAGPRDAPLVYLPGIVLGGQEISGIAASICDECMQEGKAGLVGMNVIRQFDSRLHGAKGQLELTAAPTPERTLDITGFVDIELKNKPELVNHHAFWRVRLHNRSRRTLTDVQPRVVFEGGKTVYGKTIATIPPGGEAVSLIKGSAGRKASGRFQLQLYHASW